MKMGQAPTSHQKMEKRLAPLCYADTDRVVAVARIHGKGMTTYEGTNERVAFRGRFTEGEWGEKFFSVDFLVPANFHKFLKNNFVTWTIGHRPIIK